MALTICLLLAYNSITCLRGTWGKRHHMWEQRQCLAGSPKAAVERLSAGGVVVGRGSPGGGEGLRRSAAKRMGRSTACAIGLRGKQRVYSIGRHGSPWTPDTATGGSQAVARARSLAVLIHFANEERPARRRSDG